MSVIKDTKLCQPFNNGYGPLNVMWNGKKIAGWSNKSKGCNNTSITLTGTYKDKLDYTLLGKTKVEGSPFIGTWRQSVKNPRPCLERTNDILKRGNGVLTFEEDHILVQTDESGKAAIRVFLSEPLQPRHKYLVCLFYSKAYTGDVTYFQVEANTKHGIMMYLSGYSCLSLVLKAQQYDDVEYFVVRMYGTAGLNEGIKITRIMLVDLTDLWGDSNLASDINYYNSVYSNMANLMWYTQDVDPTPDSTTETEVPNIESPYLPATVSPDSPGKLTTEEVWVETSDGVSTNKITRDDLHVWDELYSSGKINSYGAVKTFGEINWSNDTNNANIFYWNGASDIYKTENVFMDSYKRVETYGELHGSDYAYWVNDSNKRVYVKDKDISDVVDFKDIRANCKIFYHKSWPDATETKVELPVTYPYTTIVKTNTDCTVTYKKWDDSETD